MNRIFLSLVVAVGFCGAVLAEEHSRATFEEVLEARKKMTDEEAANLAKELKSKTDKLIADNPVLAKKAAEIRAGKKNPLLEKIHAYNQGEGRFNEVFSVDEINEHSRLIYELTKIRMNSDEANSLIALLKDDKITESSKVIVVRFFMKYRDPKLFAKIGEGVEPLMEIPDFSTSGQQYSARMDLRDETLKLMALLPSDRNVKLIFDHMMSLSDDSEKLYVLRIVQKNNNEVFNEMKKIISKNDSNLMPLVDKLGK